MPIFIALGLGSPNRDLNTYFNIEILSKTVKLTLHIFETREQWLSFRQPQSRIFRLKLNNRYQLIVFR